MEEKNQSEEEVVITKYDINTDFSGQVFHNWLILNRINPTNVLRYNMRCACGREYIRLIRTILDGRSSECCKCSRKKTRIWPSAMRRSL